MFEKKKNIKSKRGLVICAPSPDQLTTISVSTAKIINAMLQDDWEIDIISCQDRKAKVDATFVQLMRGATLYKVKCPFNKPSLWVFTAFRMANSIIRRKSYNLLFSISPYSWTNIVGFLLKKIYKHKLPWVVFFGDPWGNNPDLKLAPLRKVMERSVLLSSDAICYSNSKLRDWAFSQFPKERVVLERKTFIIPYFYDLRLYGESAQLKSDGKIIIRHFGQIPLGGYILHLLKAISIMFQDEPSLKNKVFFDLIGRADPRYKGSVSKLIKKFDLVEQINFNYDDSKVIHIPYSESLGLMKTADALLLLGVHPDYFHGWGNVILHVKLIDYFGADKPIFALAGQDSVTNDLLKDGISACTSDDPYAIRDALIAFINKMPKPTSLTREHFAKEAVYSQWSRVFKQIVADG